MSNFRRRVAFTMGRGRKLWQIRVCSRHRLLDWRLIELLSGNVLMRKVCDASRQFGQQLTAPDFQGRPMAKVAMRRGTRVHTNSREVAIVFVLLERGVGIVSRASSATRLICDPTVARIGGQQVVVIQLGIGAQIVEHVMLPHAVNSAALHGMDDDARQFHQLSTYFNARKIPYTLLHGHRRPLDSPLFVHQ